MGGVSVDTLLERVEAEAEHVVASCDGGYTTNLPLEAVAGGRAWAAFAYDGAPLEPAHGGPARLLVPHLYFGATAFVERVAELLVDAGHEPERVPHRALRAVELSTRRRTGWTRTGTRRATGPRPAASPGEGAAPGANVRWRRAPDLPLRHRDPQGAAA